MIAHALPSLKLLSAGMLTGAVFLADLAGEIPNGVRLVVDIAALGIILGGFFVLGRNRANLAASEKGRELAQAAAASWREERDAENAKAERLTTELHQAELGKQKLEEDNRRLLAQLEARPDLSVVLDAIRSEREHGVRELGELLERLGLPPQA